MHQCVFGVPYLHDGREQLAILVPLQHIRMTFRFAEPKRRIKGTSKETQETEHNKNICEKQRNAVSPFRKEGCWWFFSSNLLVFLQKLCASPGPGIGGVAAGVASGVATGVTGAEMEGIGDGSQALVVGSKTRKNTSRNTDSLNLSAFQV